VRASNGDGPDEVLYESPTVKVLCDWSPDGQHLLYVEIDPQTGSPNLMRLPVSGNRTPEPFLATAAIEAWGQFSPDGKWVAYQSNQSGRMEVYVRSFHGAGGQWLVSTDGGIHPRWSSNGTELLYLAPDGRLLSAAIIARGGAIEVGRPVSLFPTMIVGGGTNFPGFRQQYDVTADGRLLINVALQSAPTPITLLLNWRPHP
jgi:eukaryotic-like serine/threonine-protein kinase